MIIHLREHRDTQFLVAYFCIRERKPNKQKIQGSLVFNSDGAGEEEHNALDPALLQWRKRDLWISL